jgi:hypothetical protein
LRSDLVNAQAPLENEGRIGKQQRDIDKGALSASGARGTGNPVLDRIRMLIQNGSSITQGNASGASNRAYEQNPVLDAIRALAQKHMAQFSKPAGRNSHIPPGQIKTPDGTKAVLENRNAQWDKAAGETEKFAAQMKKQGIFLDERELRVLKTIADSVAGMREKQAVANNKAKKLIQAVLSYAADLKTQEGNIAVRGTPGVADRAGQSIIGTESAENVIDGIKIIGGKVGGKIPIDDFKAIRQSSVKNPDADSITLGKFTDGPDSYIAKAGSDSSFFDMGEQWGAIQQKYGLSDKEMFDYFNVPALEDAITRRKIIRFSHNPLDNRKSFLFQEWKYIKKRMGLGDTNLVFKGGFWYVG